MNCPRCRLKLIKVFEGAHGDDYVEYVCLGCEREWAIYDAGVQPSERIARLREMRGEVKNG